MSKNRERIRYAHERGYKVTQDGIVISPSGLILKLKHKGKRDRRLCFSVNNRTLDIRGKVEVHRLQAYQKFGEDMFKGGILVRHLDDCMFNNSYENIGLGDNSDNMMDMSPEKRLKIALIATKEVTKHNVIAEKVRKMRRQGSTYREICSEFKIAKSTVHHILHKAKTY